MAYVGMAYMVMASGERLRDDGEPALTGLCRYGLLSYGLYSYDLHSYRIAMAYISYGLYKLWPI